jgi:DNA topoisomerase-1
VEKRVKGEIQYHCTVCTHSENVDDAEEAAE